MTPILLTNRFVSASTEKNEAITLSIDCYEVGGWESNVMYIMCLICNFKIVYSLKISHYLRIWS